MKTQWNHKIFGVREGGFEALALHIFRLQATDNKVFKSYLDALKVKIDHISSIEKIPFLPIRFFKSHLVKTGEFEANKVFESSRTTGLEPSRHSVKDLDLYEESFTRMFENLYGPIADWCILGLLPSYLEREHSSLVYMVKKMIALSGNEKSGFYLDDQQGLINVLKAQEEQQSKTLLIGVSFALLDLAEKFPIQLKHTVVMETGGMKGRRKEMVRAELHYQLQFAFGLPKIHSEYGMTELMSQAYSSGDGIFSSPPWMKVFIRDEEDPFAIKTKGAGVINIIDLANVFSCSFIATDDAGVLNEDGSFEVLGRADGSDVRGCNLLVYG